MKIAILGSVALTVPPFRQGGTEWIAYYQAEGLGKLGHKILLFAATGSKRENYELIEVGGGDTIAGSGTIQDRFYGSSIPDRHYTESSRNLRKENVYLAQVIQQLIDRKDDYDLILNNMRGEAVFIPLAKTLGKPFVNVMHLPLFPELASLFKQYNTNIITISNAQRKNFPFLNYLATIYNCVDVKKFVFNKKGSDYLLMLGSISPHKNQLGAIRVARKLGMDLVLAGKIGDQNYFNKIKKEIDGVKIQWVGELSVEAKMELYQNARAFLFPILWEEPFGLVMIEAMACGTPVIAFANGAIPEVLVDGLTGYVIEGNSEEKMAEAIKKIDKIRREDCRKYVEEKFTVEKMVGDYEKALLEITFNI